MVRSGGSARVHPDSVHPSLHNLDAADVAIDFFAATPGVEFIASCLGRHDLVATVGVSSLDEMHEVLDKARAMESVASVECWLHLKIVQERYAKPLDKMLAMKAQENGH